MDVEGLPLKTLKALPADELDALLAFGKPITFRIGTATILAEFNRNGDALTVNLAHVDGGGEGVLVLIWKAVEAYAAERNYASLTWYVHALTCVRPNPRLQVFLARRSFTEIDHAVYGPVFTRTQDLTAPRAQLLLG